MIGDFCQENEKLKRNTFLFFFQKSADVLFSPFQKPKQKRHRCRNPNKLDINTLTGEERVPVVNKRNGKKVKMKLVQWKSSIMSFPMKSTFSVPGFVLKSLIIWHCQLFLLECTTKFL